MSGRQTEGTALIERLVRLRVSGLADQFDKLDLVPPVLAHELQPIGPAVKFAGFAFCVKGRKLPGAGWKAIPGPRDSLYDSLDQRIAPGAVLVLDTGSYDDTAVFGAGMGLGLLQRGCAGAIIDGAVRDVEELMAIGLPTRARARSAIRFMGRFALTEIDCPIEVRGLAGPVRVAPGDLVLADQDGIIVLPADFVEQAIAQSEKFDQVEALIKTDVKRGVPRQEAAARHRR